MRSATWRRSWGRRSCRAVRTFLFCAAFLLAGGISISPAEPLKNVRTVILDAGHGGGDFGAKSKGLNLEKDVTLALAKEIQKRLNEYDVSLRVVFTRGGDDYLTSDDRVLFANRNSGDLLISLHACSGFQSPNHGIRIYRYPSDEEGGEVEGQTWATAQRRFGHDTRILAESLRERFQEAFSEKSVQIVSLDLTLFHGLEMPAVLVEPICLANPNDDLKLADPAFLAGIARAVVEAVVEYDRKLAAE